MKRISAFLVAIMVLLSGIGTAYATDTSYRASLTLSRYIAELFPGDHSGEIIVSYDVKASLRADSVGVESITFYTSDGDYVTTVTGTTGNGLVKTNNSGHIDDFVQPLRSGEYYYAEVTVFAKIGSDYDSRTVTTSTVWVS